MFWKLYIFLLQTSCYGIRLSIRDLIFLKQYLQMQATSRLCTMKFKTETESIYETNWEEHIHCRHVKMDSSYQQQLHLQQLNIWRWKESLGKSKNNWRHTLSAKRWPIAYLKHNHIIVGINSSSTAQIRQTIANTHNQTHICLFSIT